MAGMGRQESEPDSLTRLAAKSPGACLEPLRPVKTRPAGASIQVDPLSSLR
jgi:hypothetical protein